MSELLPYVICAGVGLVVGLVLGFMSRNSRIDSLKAQIVKLMAELDGRRIQTSRSAPESPAQRAPVSSHPRSPHSGSPAATAPLPSGVRYVIADKHGGAAPIRPRLVEDDDDPISDAEYARRFGRSDYGPSPDGVPYEGDGHRPVR